METILDTGHSWLLSKVVYHDALEIYIVETIKSANPEKIQIAGVDLGEGYSAEVTETSRRFVVVFEDVLAYQVLNESYTTADEYEIRTKGVLCRYERSHYLDFIQSSTLLNNGNVQSQTVTVGSNIIKQSYTYDQVNRLLSAAETYNQAARWTQSYTFDQVGNRSTLTNSGVDWSLLPTQSTRAVSSSTNRISAAGYVYDNAGNLKDEPASLNKHYKYDAENRLVDFNSGATKYFYDGDGHRVKKITVGSQTTTKVFVYNAGGQLIAEYTSDPVPPPAGGGGTSYLTTDHLGSTRVVTGTNVSQPVKARYDYLPYGEELPSSVGGRSSIGGYGGADSTRQKFTQKERDNESGLDYFGARYYSSAQGRFTSPDEFDPVLGLQGAADRREGEKQFRRYLTQPQHWNRYPYALNNPLRYVDPDGFGETLTVRLNIVWDETSNYTEEEKNRIRQAYVDRAKKAFGKIDIAFEVTETTGTAKAKDQQSREITSGKSNDAVNVFFTKGEVGPSSEVTQFGKSQIFISTTKGAVEGNLIHGLIHAFGIASDVNGYTGVTAERDTIYGGRVLDWLPFLASYDDERKPHKVTYRQTGGAVNSYESPYSPTVFDVIREGARRYLKK